MERHNFAGFPSQCRRLNLYRSPSAAKAGAITMGKDTNLVVGQVKSPGKPPVFAVRILCAHPCIQIASIPPGRAIGTFQRMVTVVICITKLHLNIHVRLGKAGIKVTTFTNEFGSVICIAFRPEPYQRRT